MRAGTFVFVALIFAACKDPPPPPSPAADAAIAITPDGAIASAPPSDAAIHPIVDASIIDAASADAAASTAIAGDAGASDCRLLAGPQKMPFVGPGALKVDGAELSIVTNDAGKPRVMKLPIPPIPPANAVIVDPPKPASTYGVTWPPCIVAGTHAVCPGRSGSITRTQLPTGPTKEIAKGRSSTRVAAAALGSHTVTAYLDEKQTTEGRVLHAMVLLDDGEPLRLSDEGSGATYVELASRGSTVVAMYLDARAAMVPIHARLLTLDGDKLKLGKDTVVAVGGAPERGIAGRIGSSPARTLFMVPMSEDALRFGMASITLSDPPKDDEKVVWSIYPNGLDPAPIAATHGFAPIRVARVRPTDKDPHAPRGLEIGALSEDGTFTSHGMIVTGKGVTDLDIANDGLGGTFILYGGAEDAWLERRKCP